MRIANEEGKIIETKVVKEEMQEAIIGCNRQHCKIAYDVSIWQDKICDQLQDDRIKYRTLGDILEREIYDNEEICEFHKLLKYPNNSTGNRRCKRRRKTGSRLQEKLKTKCLLHFSKRMHSMCKYALGSERMPSILVNFYNAIIKE